jgi:hypothetical protein
MVGNGGLVPSGSSLLTGTNKVLPEVSLVGILLVGNETAVPAVPLCDGLVVAVAVALFCAVDIDAVHPIILLLGESVATTSTNVEGGVLNDPSAIIAVITGTGVDVVFSLQVCQRSICGPLDHFAC